MTGTRLAVAILRLAGSRAAAEAGLPARPGA